MRQWPLGRGASTREILSLLDTGDTLAHVFTPKNWGVIKPNSTVATKLEEAIKQGMVLGVANTVSNLRLEITFPELGRILAVNRMKELVETGADIIVTQCPGCIIQLKDKFKELKIDGVKVLDLTQIVVMEA